MATFTASIIGGVGTIKRHHSGVNWTASRWTVSATGTAGSVVLMAQVPVNALILDYMLFVDDAAADQTVKIGFSFSPSALGAALSLSTSASSELNNATSRGLNGNESLLPYRVTLSDDATPRWKWVQAEFSVAISASSHGAFTLFYGFDSN
jgi:hypothetical protein